MLITLLRGELEEALKGFRLLKRKKGASNAPLAIRIDAGPEAIRLSALRLDHTLTYAMPASDKKDSPHQSFHLAMPHLEEAVKSADRKTGIVIDLEKEILRYRARGIEIDSPFHTVPEIPDPGSEIGETGEGQRIPLPPQVMQAVSQATVAASDDPGRAILNGIHLTRETVTATNGRRLYTRRIDSMPVSLGEEGIILPVHPLLKVFEAGGTPLLHLAPVPKKEGLLRRFQLSLGAWVWSGFLVQGTYPNWRQVLPRDHEVRVRLEMGQSDATRLIGILPKLPGAKEKDSPVDLVIGEGRATVISGSNGLRNNLALKESKVSDGEAQVTVRFNATFLIDALKQDFRVITVRDEFAPVVMEDQEKGRIHLWMPLRPIDPSPQPAVAQAKEPSPTHETMKERNHQPVGPVADPKNGESETHGTNRLNGNGAHGPTAPIEPSEERDPLDLLLEEIASVKEALRDNLARVNGLAPLVRQVGKENRALEKEHRSLRRNLRSLQSLDV